MTLEYLFKITVKKQDALLHVKVVFLTIISLLTCASIVSANEKRDAFCPDTEQYAPHGIVVRMGEEYYRTCGDWNLGGGIWRQFILKVNPSLIPDLFSTYSPSNLRVMEKVEGIDRLSNQLRSLTENGTRRIGQAQYRVYQSKSLEPSGKPARSVSVFMPEGDSAIPQHWTSCWGWSQIEQGGWLNCSVYVQSGEVYGKLLFIGSKERGFAFLNHFPEFAKDIERVLKVANVTDKFHEVSKYLDIVD